MIAPEPRPRFRSTGGSLQTLRIAQCEGLQKLRIGGRRGRKAAGNGLRPVLTPLSWASCTRSAFPWLTPWATLLRPGGLRSGLCSRCARSRTVRRVARDSALGGGHESSAELQLRRLRQLLISHEGLHSGAPALGFVSGHDFSHADRAPVGLGFSPCHDGARFAGAEAPRGFEARPRHTVSMLSERPEAPAAGFLSRGRGTIVVLWRSHENRRCSARMRRFGFGR